MEIKIDYKSPDKQQKFGIFDYISLHWNTPPIIYLDPGSTNCL